MEDKNKNIKLQRVTLNKITIDDRNYKEQRKPAKRGLPVWAIVGICAAFVLIVVSLYFFIFADQGLVASAATSTPDVTFVPTEAPTPELTPTPTPVPTVTPEPMPSTMWGAKFPDKFTQGEVEKDDTSYKSDHINVSVSKVQKEGLTYFVADIYVTDLEYFRSGFAKNKYGGGNHQYADDMSPDFGAIVAMDGDYYSQNKGPVVRNGILYRQEDYKDILVMYNDGTMETFQKGEYDLNAILAKGVWQMWTFGPQLLEDGQPMTEFNSTVTRANPRAAVGYYEPGHYCFVLVDGRQGSYSKGLTMTELSQLMYDLGCKAAFNLDGGGSAQMAFDAKTVNKPCDNYRQVADILYITDTPESAPEMPKPKK